MCQPAAIFWRTATTTVEPGAAHCDRGTSSASILSARCGPGETAAEAWWPALIGDAKKILGDTFDFKGKSDADIRKEAVLKKMGDKAKDKNDGYYENAFDVLVAQAADGNTNDTGGDNMRQVFQNNQGNGNGGTYDSKSIEAARAAADKKRQDAWKN